MQFHFFVNAFELTSLLWIFFLNHWELHTREQQKKLIQDLEHTDCL